MRNGGIAAGNVLRPMRKSAAFPLGENDFAFGAYSVGCNPTMVGKDVFCP
jgi:hypothetical protein